MEANMKYYDEYDTDDIDVAIGTDQLDSEEDDIVAALGGEYDDILETDDDDIDTLMDAEDDKDVMNDIPTAVLAARTLVEECEGVTEEGYPKATLALTMETVNKITEDRKMVAQQAVYKPVVSIAKRHQFTEINLSFPTANDRDMRVMMNHLDKYGALVANEDETSTEITQLTFAILPVSALGTFYMAAINPIFWVIQPSEMNGPLNQVKILFDCEDIAFIQTDEIDVASIESSIQRELEAEQSAYEAMEAKDEARRARNSQYMFNANDDDAFGEE
jgi:hypothetical protein